MPSRLLLVDDEPLNLAVLEGHLSRLGHEIMRATDGRTALALIDSHRPDLVLLDVVMPGFSGLDVLAHIRARDDANHIPVILVTAHQEREQRLLGLEAGADDYLEKPIDAPILLRRVTTLLKLKEARDAVRVQRDELATRNAALLRLERERRKLTEFVVHDLKNPLTSVCMGIDYCLSRVPADDVDVHETLCDVREGSQRLRTMIEDLLVISRLENAQLPIRFERVSLHDILEAAMRLRAQQATEKQVGFSFHEESTQIVRTDRKLLLRVFENILDNSFRYTPSGGRIAVETHAGDDVEIAISNSGPAIPAAMEERIFEKFARGDHEEETHSNAGLGLYFCRCAIHALGGRIEMRKTEGWSTSFVVHLPLNGET